MIVPNASETNLVL